jgi:hypothetical protein
MQMHGAIIIRTKQVLQKAMVEPYKDANNLEAVSL